jgi:hypothetical protein
LRTSGCRRETRKPGSIDATVSAAGAQRLIARAQQTGMIKLADANQ